MLCEWRVRKKGQEANPYADYREFPSVFCLKINHSGTFTTPPMIRYKGEEPLVFGTTSEHNEPDIGFGSEAEVDPSRNEVGQSSRNGSGSENASGSENGSSSDNGSRSDSDEGVRKKALRKVARLHKEKIGKGETIWK
uniref:Transposase, MuDR n=1 Tax=Tanacetum cinerariifolium TaxID=118510 RepID=A0A6L2K8R1_TANCI|nr:transposase, MuDR [Tanacetum cinerariifolium]